MWKSFKVWLLQFLLFVIVSGQNLNVIPELFRAYVNEYPELQTLNILGNVSDVLFSNAKYESSVNLGNVIQKCCCPEN